MKEKINEIKKLAKYMDTTNKFSCDLELQEIIKLCEEIQNESKS